MSATLKDPGAPIDHGEILGAAGRRPMWAGDLITDGRGTVYMIGRWSVSEEDMRTIGILRHKMRMAVLFSVIDISADLQARAEREELNGRGGSR